MVAVLVLTAGAPAASAAQLSMSFTEARADVGVQLSDEALFAPPATAPFAASIDPGTGAISGGILDVPEFSTHIVEPIEADVTVEFEIGLITGSYAAATGALTLKGEAGGTLTSSGATFEGEECVVSTTPPLLELSTAGDASEDGGPPSGAPFSVGLTGPGSIAGRWTDMHAAPVDSEDPDNVDFCANVASRMGGPGGVWLAQEGDLTPPAAPLLTGFDPSSPSPSGAPRVRGAAEVGSTVRVYAGPGCLGAPVATGSAAALASPGIAVAVAEGATASFSASVTDAAQNVSACSAPIAYTHQRPDTPAPACLVPRLRGKTLARAKRALKAAGCGLGKVRKPKWWKGKRRRGALVVKRSRPGAGATPANRKVHLKLGPKVHPKPKRAHHRSRTHRRVP